MSRGICSEIACGRTVRAGGLCQRHYKEFQLYGKVTNTRNQQDPNEVVIKEDYALVHLYNIKNECVAKTKIDIKDVEKVQKYKWYLTAQGYACSHKVGPMQCFLLGVDSSYFDLVDHKDTRKLNNRRYNLRQCTGAENSRNVSINSVNTSGVKGVYRDRGDNYFIAQIQHNNKCIVLGSFTNLVVAARAYNTAAKELFGEFAKTNNIKKLKIKLGLRTG